MDKSKQSVFDNVFQGKVDHDDVSREALRLAGAQASGEVILAIVVRRLIERVDLLEKRLDEMRQPRRLTDDGTA